MSPERQIYPMNNPYPINGDFRAPFMFKASFYLAVFLFLGLFIQACSAGGTTPTPVEEFPAEPTGQQKGVLHVAVQPIVQTDPAFISSDPEVLVANHIYDYLVDVTPNNTITPRLATGWKVSDDGLTYEFTLAEGVMFHDGSTLTAEDVVWTFNRLRDPEVGSATVDLYSNIADIQASAPNVVTFVLAEPNPFFLYDLSDNHALVLKSGTEDPGISFQWYGSFQSCGIQS